MSADHPSHGTSSTGRTRRSARTLVMALAALAVSAGVLGLSTASAASEVWVKNPSFRSGTTGWTAGSGDRVSRVDYRDSRGTAGHLTSTSSTGSGKYLAMISSPSTSTVKQQGSRVHVAARVRTSSPASSRPIFLRIVEVHDGKRVQEMTSRNPTRSTAWFWAGADLTTRYDDSRLQVFAAQSNMSGSHYMRIQDVTVTVTAPKPAPSTVTTPTAAPTTPAPTTSAPTAASPSPPTCEDIDYADPDQGSLTFVEDFDGTALDPTRWRVRDDTFLNQDAAFISKENVSVHDGYLDIAGRREPESRWRVNDRALYGAENRIRRYSTGYVDSIKATTYESPDEASSNRFSQKYGYFEARMWVPSAATMSRGIWPAFWLRADSQPGEIDPMESYGGPTIRSFDPSSSYEWNSWGDTAAGSQPDNASQQTHGRADVGSDKIWQGWHTFAVNWSPTCLRYLYDGRTVGIVDFADPSTKPYFTGRTFDDTFHIRLNMQVGSKYWGWPDEQHTRDVFNFRIDHVKVYQGKQILQ